MAEKNRNHDHQLHKFDNTRNTENKASGKSKTKKKQKKKKMVSNANMTSIRIVDKNMTSTRICIAI